jgi:probable HAF family extracellular repeat protein
MTRQISKHFALSLTCLGLALGASRSMAQSPAGLRHPHRWSLQASASASHQVHTPPPNSPTYTFSLFDFPQSPNTAASGINNKLEMVGAYGPTVPLFEGGNGFLLQVGEKKGVISESYQTVNVPGGTGQFANGINDAGQIVGEYTDASGVFRSYLWNKGTFTPVGYPGAFGTNASAINRSEVIVGGWWLSDLFTHGFELSGGVYTSFDFPGASQTFAYGISNSGDIVGYYDDAEDVTHGFVLSGGTYTSIDPPGSVETYAVGINDAGDIVGAYCTTAQCTQDQNTIQGFLLSKGIYTTISVPGSTSTIIEGINDSGVIAGSYGNCDTGAGLAHAFIANP